jgi:hypothetical protein
MKMKNKLIKSIEKTAFLSVVLLCFGSCSDLPIDTQGELAAEGFYNSVADIETGTLGVYSVLADKLFANSENFCHFWAADDRTAVTGSNKTFYLQYDQMTPLETNPWQQNGWNQLWEIVGAANTFLDNEERMRNIVQGDQVLMLDRSLGEVRYLRAFIYFELVRTWGQVPLLTSQVGVTGQESLASIQEIYDVIIADLLFAKTNLEPESIGGIYRANSWMAQALLADVYLTTAGFPLQISANYTLAASEARNIIDNGPYALEASLNGIMGQQSNNLNEDGNTEAIIALPANVGLDGWGSANFQAEAILFGDKVVEVGFFQNFPEGPRKEFTFDDVNGQIQFSKEKFGEQTNSVDKDINIFRYSELLLIYAEAQIRATGNNSDASALSALNAVRNRAGLADVSSATWEDVVWEKAWELAGEWSRWYDIVRTETLDEVNAMRDPIDNNLTPLGSTLTEADPWSPYPANDASANPNLQN